VISQHTQSNNQNRMKITKPEQSIPDRNEGIVVLCNEEKNGGWGLLG